MVDPCTALKTWLAFGLAFFFDGVRSGNGPIQAGDPHHRQHPWGPTTPIKVADDAVKDGAKLQAEVDVLLERVNDQMSTHRPDFPELSRLTSTGTIPRWWSRDTARVVTEAYTSAARAAARWT